MSRADVPPCSRSRALADRPGPPPCSRPRPTRSTPRSAATASPSMFPTGSCCSDTVRVPTGTASASPCVSSRCVAPLTPGPCSPTSAARSRPGDTIGGAARFAPPRGNRSMRWTVYVDLDAYYVACELRERPELIGKPVIVGPPPAAGPTRGVVLSASYEARAFGVHSAQPAAQAARLCPDATWIPPDHSKYGRIAVEVRALLGRFSPDLVPLSIDEAALGVDLESADEARDVAERVQAALRAE